ncbi:MAG: 2-succinyl-5-enolpyruvyl-6-hydroxy-3-cyclohexene-1-carboxylic-acid synthase [Cyclobacteriaceae bacterium]|nr:2-succinyl-5-enolpyruvyl-6-hydroxy-3-cyclohexene-1-carboxylic-acid synthase [Cyclobacteriaceae bacterium]
MNYQPIYNIAEICHTLGVTDAILSPGSRNAPLIISFNRHSKIKTYVINDERSAAFIALGMSQKSKQPVVLIATSGSAAYNYAPAIAEAYFQQIPLIILTADRPQEWIDQRDGQTIYQENIYGNHVKKSFQCPVDTDNKDAAWYFERIFSDAINLADDGAKGPVHINIPFREPFYPEKDIKPNYNSAKTIQKSFTTKQLSTTDWAHLVDEWNRFEKRLIVIGQLELSSKLLLSLGELKAKKHIPVIGGILSNMHAMPDIIKSHDIFIDALDEKQLKELQPELLITFGKSVLSKGLKKYLRTHKPKAHWHIQQDGLVADTFQSLTRVIPVSPFSFFNSIKDIVKKSHFDYSQKWLSYQNTSREFVKDFHTNEVFNEFTTIDTILSNLPMSCDIHLANSMTVRYANIIGLSHSYRQIELFCNRGTSGIDGSTSTALGSALKAKKTTLLITGDMAFFYDRNAFWHHHIPDNLRIIVLNNHGGGIFDLIGGPSKLPEKEAFFITKQDLKAKNLAEEFGLKYYHCATIGGLSNGLNKFWVQDGHPKILEIESLIDVNTQVFKKFKKQAKQLWNQPTLGKA